MATGTSSPSTSICIEADWLPAATSSVEGSALARLASDATLLPAEELPEIALRDQLAFMCGELPLFPKLLRRRSLDKRRDLEHRALHWYAHAAGIELANELGGAVAEPRLFRWAIRVTSKNPFFGEMDRRLEVRAVRTHAQWLGLTRWPPPAGAVPDQAFRGNDGTTLHFPRGNRAELKQISASFSAAPPTGPSFAMTIPDFAAQGSFELSLRARSFGLSFESPRDHNTFEAIGVAMAIESLGDRFDAEVRIRARAHDLRKNAEVQAWIERARAYEASREYDADFLAHAADLDDRLTSRAVAETTSVLDGEWIRVHWKQALSERERGWLEGRRSTLRAMLPAAAEAYEAILRRNQPSAAAAHELGLEGIEWVYDTRESSAAKARLDARRTQLPHVAVEVPWPQEHIAQLALTPVECPSAGIPLGASRFGGAPDVPPGFEWPLFEGEPLSFVAQIDLAAIPPHPSLPNDGWLLAFVALDRVVDRGADAIGSRILHIRTARTELRRWPEHVDTHAWRYARVETGAPYQREMGHDSHLLGHAAPIQSDPRVTAWLEAEAVSAGHLGALDAPRINAAVSNWRLLLQVDSEPANDFCWGPDTGRLYYMIRDEDLAARRFDRVVTVCQFA